MKWKRFCLSKNEWYEESHIEIEGVEKCHIVTSPFTLRKKKSIFVFPVSGSASVKAARRTLMKLSPGLNFTKLLWAASSCESIFCSSYVFTIWVNNAIGKQKASRKMLLKRTLLDPVHGFCHVCKVRCHSVSSTKWLLTYNAQKYRYKNIVQLLHHTL